ncbi:MAG: AraC family transcriptional regulator ligand-binding domain-containing protein [Geminicoccaceae bacterium]|jgi:AraC-like DNA-binding protein|nr:AraC family transcriptional regulator ligand-binding domain-containing protein [Geminicoccaceae bacterium]MCB9966713.1 AraC family transcriptional regulator ligand-binding domain-containing protein [Geminicoccaceae bacterium]HRY23815.1 AraC family transcriptional regulator ligand-binding domain-containing protein [Geminicoccaceae bacterium]
MPSRFITTAVRGFGPLPRIVREAVGERAANLLFTDAGVPLALLDRPDARLPLVDMIAIFERAALLLDDPLLGLDVGRAMSPETYGDWVRYALAGRTLRHGIARLCRAMRYYQAAGNIRAEVHGNLVRLAYHQSVVDAARARQHADHALLPLLAFVRRFLGPAWQPHWVELPYRPAAGTDELATRLGVEVRFGRPGVGMVFERDFLDAPGNTAPPAFAALRRMVEGRPDGEVTAALIDVVDLRLTDGEVALDGAASRLGLQRRALQRHLQAEGRSYRQIVDAARRAQAEKALATTARPIAEIAQSLGYGEPAHFSRAFRRWHGCSPNSWRRERAG